ncbi:MAG: peptidoglycan D,D-transpeptidase FtsI family protein [Oscillospiraceae bacterium]
MDKKLYMVSVTAFVTAIILILRIAFIDNDIKVLEAASGRGRYVLRDKCEYAAIYDRNGQRLNNRSTEYIAVLDPHNADSLGAAAYVCDREAFHNGMSGNLPFFCRVTSENIRNVIVFRKYIRTDNSQPARHIIGYTSDGRGVCGLELAYDDFLRGSYTENCAVFSVDAVGSVLEGLVSEKTIPKELKSGVVTTLDLDIQTVAEEAFRNSGYKKGAVVVMDIKSGDIIACASFPEFDPQNLTESLESADSPFVNRAFSAYSVGSIFKLVTATAALESGISEDFSYICDGSIDIDGQIFNCHKWGGHGEISMEEAMISSCNPYFIALSETLSPKLLHDTAENLGFGEKSVFADGLSSQSGYLPTARELSVRAEKGNFSFGQGKLTATPIQICRLTCAVANNGLLPQARLIHGFRDENGIEQAADSTESYRVMSCLTAQKLKRYMCGVVNASNSFSLSELISCAGKTSTAQTGRFNADGKEELNCWFTGYFPTDSPQYAVTVLVENGISGNASCGKIFKDIAEKICNTNSKSFYRQS